MEVDCGTDEYFGDPAGEVIDVRNEDELAGELTCNLFC